MNSTVLVKIFKADQGISALPLRLSSGVIFTAHGAQKLFGWFGGYGLEGTGQFMASQGLTPGLLMAVLAGGVEFFGGLALLLGLAVRPAAFLLAITMLVAVVSVHLPNGLFLSNSGYEFAMALLGISLALLFLGGGRWSIDTMIARKLES